MAALKEEQSYGLSSGGLRKRAGQSYYLVRLTDTALRAIEEYQRAKGSLGSQPLICFKGNQGCIRIPTPAAKPSNDVQVFSFYLSSDSKEKPQASFECVRQYISSSGRSQLECQGTIQDKITVCATDDSYKLTRERMSQAEKESWSRAAIEIKPETQYRKKSLPVPKKHGLSTTSESPCIAKPPPLNPLLPVKKSVVGTTVQRPLRERLTHLLALRPYRKAELILRLERDRVPVKDQAELLSVLDEVARQNPKDNSYYLKEELYRQVQRKWPCYTEEERRHIHHILIRKSFKGSQACSRPPQPSPGKSPVMKRTVSSEVSDQQVIKKSKVADSESQSQLRVPPPDVAHHPVISTLEATTVVQRRQNLNDCKSNSTAQGNYCHANHKGLDSTQPQTKNREVSDAVSKPSRTECSPAKDTDSKDWLIKKKKSKRHKDRETEKLLDEEKGKDVWEEGKPKENWKQLDIEDPPSKAKTTEKPDYLLKYLPITSLDQRESYKDDFSAEYNHYLELHSRIGTIKEKFVELGSHIKTLTPGTEEYKVVEDQILEEYRKFKKTYPTYWEEKAHCEYLHQKLSHIKDLIQEYDQKNGLS
ncbi:RNA polymerase II elongation factor ELL3 [Protopterus annectens]|uniref:RNA polymerase II elongation factor ELL3 n=1 Tax=Protopterus annectens TaxID=7888 RepID=UPI001CFC416C|nr:RNA polymerase II elongation factor ELL3 [Protopterus annectens]